MQFSVKSFNVIQGRSQTNCDWKTIGDPISGWPKRCYCESLLPKDPVKCADEGGNCECPSGNVFFGRKQVVAGKDADFDSMNDEPYKFQKATGSSMGCNSGVFGGDPTPGFAK